MSVIYSVKASDKANTLVVNKTIAVDIPNGYSTLLTFNFDKATYILGFNNVSLKADIYQVQNDLALIRVSQSNLATAWDIITPFLLGGNNYILAYQASSGLYNFYRIEDDLTLTLLYKYQMTYGAAITTGYTTIAPFSNRNGVYFVSYDINSGRVNVCQVTVPASYPLKVAQIWGKSWADGWTRFAFFTMGGENFFLKTNIKYHTANIDHINSDPSQGTNEVGTKLPIDQTLDIVKPFYMAGGRPYFITYKQIDGSATFNSIDSDCLGWIQEATLTMDTGLSAVVPFALGNDVYILTY